MQHNAGHENTMNTLQLVPDNQQCSTILQLKVHKRYNIMLRLAENMLHLV